MKLTSLSTSLALVGLVTLGGISLKTFNLELAQASTQEVKSKTQLVAQVPDEEMKDVTGLTTQQKIAMLTKDKGKFGSGDELRRFFFGDLEPIAVQPGGAGMVVNLYNKANNITIAYCATYDVVVAVKTGRVTAFAPNEVK